MKRKSILRTAVLFTVLFVTVLLLVIVGSAISQQTQTPLQQAQAEIARLQILLEDSKAERNNLIIQVATLNNQLNVFTAGVKKTERLLQEAINNGGKVDFEELINTGWNIIIPDSTATQPSNKGGTFK